MFDCYRDVPLTFRMFFSMFKDFDLSVLTAEEFSYFELSVFQYGIVAVGVVLMFAVSLAGRKGSVREQISRYPYVVKAGIFILLLFAVLLFGNYGIEYDATQFIYNQF
jgi:hypothetical protein